MKQIVLSVALVLMVGWTLYEFLAPENEAIQVKDSSALVGLTTRHLVGPLEKDMDPFSGEIVGLEVGNMAPDFELATLDGDVVKLSDFRGQRVMINFWATWCPPCRAEMPDMEQFHVDQDVVILAINLTETESSIQQIQEFVDEFGLTFPVLLDETISVATMYEIRPIPTSYLVDSNGVIQNRAFGALTYELMVDEFEKMQ